ncbi:MAG: NUDIX domain-containing protein [Clostridia bacterium]|nr:NUDIX domain-containing protein [Clostridia bacterium]
MNFRIAVKGLIFKQNRFLVLIRSDQEMRNTEIKDATPEDLPGGMLKENETVQQGLNREIKEETGICVDVVKAIKVLDYFYSDIHLISIIFLCKYRSGKIMISDEHKGYKWIKVGSEQYNELPEWLKDVLEQIY